MGVPSSSFAGPTVTCGGLGGQALAGPALLVMLAVVAFGNPALPVSSEHVTTGSRSMTGSDEARLKAGLAGKPTASETRRIRPPQPGGQPARRPRPPPPAP